MKRMVCRYVTEIGHNNYIIATAREYSVDGPCNLGAIINYKPFIQPSLSFTFVTSRASVSVRMRVMYVRTQNTHA